MRIAVLLLLLLLSSPAAPAEYAEINGVRIYYEIHGQGRPTVLLHGGADSIAGSLSQQMAAFAKTRRVIALEQRGHGHTADSPGLLSYAQMTEDTAALLRKLGVENADVVGWSDGGIIALMLAIRHPSLVRRVVASGANVNPQGLTPQAREWAETKLETWTGPNSEYHAKVSPDGPAQWPILVKKLKRLWLETPTPGELSFDQLKKVQQPSLIVSGDRDTVTHEHTVAMFHALPAGQLFILPDTGHNTFRLRPDWMNTVIVSFLDAEIKPPPR